MICQKMSIETQHKKTGVIIAQKFNWFDTLFKLWKSELY